MCDNKNRHSEYRIEDLTLKLPIAMSLYNQLHKNYPNLCYNNLQFKIYRN